MSQQALHFAHQSAPAPVLSPLLELGAYEAIWLEHGATFKTVAERFRADPDALPSELIPPEIARKTAEAALARLASAGVDRFGVRIHRAGEYPLKLRDARHPVELLYFQGWWNLVETPSIAVVGTRNPSSDGVARAQKIVRALVDDGRTIVSGLAAGIDTVAHQAALDAGGITIAVLGTPLSSTYPRQNKDLQRQIAAKHLIVSQVPVLRYHQQHPAQNKFFFPERNITMSALTGATVIVEAGETSGTLVQARAALQQGRKLFILESCFHNKSLTWPARFEQQGAIRVRTYDDIRRALRLEANQGR